MRNNNNLVSGLKNNGPYTSGSYSGSTVDSYGKPIRKGSYLK